MLALPFDADRLAHALFVLDPRPSAANRDALYRELAALDRRTTRATVLSTNGKFDIARQLAGFDVDFAYMKDRSELGGPIGRTIARRRRIESLAPDSVRVLVDDERMSWSAARRLSGIAAPASIAAWSRSRAAPPPVAPTPPIPGVRHVAFVLKPDLAREMASSRQSLHTIAGLAAHGVRVTVVCEISQGTIHDLLAVNGYADEAMRRLVDHVRIEEPRHATRVIAELREVLARVRAAGADLLYFRQVRIASMLLPAARALGYRVVLEAHEPYMTVAMAERSRLWKGDAGLARHALAMARNDRAFDVRTYREVDAVTCISRGMRRWVRRHSDRPTLLLRNGAPPPVDPERRYVEEERPIDAIYAGFAHVDKGLDVLIDAIALVPRARLLVAGGPTEEDVAPYRAQAERLRIADRVEFRLWMPQPELFRAMRSARVGVHPLPGRGGKLWRTYTCPLKILEYMAQGTPVVATDLPAVREMVRHGWNGWLVQPKSAEALAEGIARVLSDPPFAERLRDAALRRIRGTAHARRAARLFRFLSDIAAGP